MRKEFMPYIEKNIIKCNTCEDIIESETAHDFKWCRCGNVAVDGGKQYLKRCAKKYDGISSAYEDLSVIKKPKLTISQVFECEDVTYFAEVKNPEKVYVLVDTKAGKRLYEEFTGDEVALKEEIINGKFEVME